MKRRDNPEGPCTTEPCGIELSGHSFSALLYLESFMRHRRYAPVAAEFGITVPGVRQSLILLEKRMGSPLISRSQKDHRSVTFSDADAAVALAESVAERRPSLEAHLAKLHSRRQLFETSDRAAKSSGDERVVWIPVWLRPDFEVSNQGKVRCLSAVEIVTPFISTSGYQVVDLGSEGRSFVRNCHSVVFEAFCGALPPRHRISHVDGNLLNNPIENLVAVPDSDDRGSRAAPITGAKLSEQQRTEIHLRAVSGVSTAELAFEFGVTRPYVHYLKEC